MASKHTSRNLGEATIRLRGKTLPIGGGRDGDDVYTTPWSFRGITSQPLMMGMNKCRGEVTTTHCYDPGLLASLSEYELLLVITHQYPIVLSNYYEAMCLLATLRKSMKMPNLYRLMDQTISRSSSEKISP